MNRLLENVIIKIFVDNVFLHRYIICHRLPERSIFINNRQFHICARCTGLLIGSVLSMFLILFPIRDILAYIFPIFFTILAIDGFTQKINLRQSNNKLRFLTGITTGLSLLPFILLVIIHIHERI